MRLRGARIAKRLWPATRPWAIVVALISAPGLLPETASAQVTPPPPACAGAVGAQFEGLPSSVLAGHNQIYSIESTEEFFEVGRYKVVMSEGGSPFFSGRVKDGEELFINLDWNDGPATVTATGIVEDIDGARCAFSIAKNVRPVRRAFFPSRCSNAGYRPRSVIVACGDGNLQLRSMRWRGWNRALASGRGVALYNDCDPYCAVGRFHRARVRVLLSGRKRCSGADRYVYTVLHYRFRRGRQSSRARAPFPCSIYSE